MKRKLMLSALLVASVASLASCSPKVEDVLAGYDTSLNTTVKLTYNSNYNVDVDANGGTGNMDSFKHQIRATSVVEMDLGADLYIKISKTKKDLLISETEETKTEEILYKDGGKYYYDTSSSIKAVEVANAEAAAKVAEILKTVTYEQAGGLTLDSLLYNSMDKNYEMKNFGLTETWTLEDLPAPEYSVKDNCVTVTYKPEYVGYQTDGGMSDFSNTTDGHAAVCTVVTNDKGQVTSWKEAYNNASLDFAIMNPAPTVLITGERSFTATYGEELTKANSVAKTPSTAVLATTTGGTFDVKTCAMGDFANMSAVENGGNLELGKIICVKPAALEGYEVDTVTVNGSTEPMIDPANAGGWYCFNVVIGENTVEVTFKEKGEVVVPTTVTYASSVAGGTFEVKAFTLPQTFEDLASGAEIASSKFIAVKPVAADGYTLKKVAVNGSTKTAAEVAGWYCFTPVKGANNVEVLFTKTTKEGNYVVYDLVEGGSYQVSDFTTNGFVFVPLADGDSVQAGHYIAIKPAALEGYEVKSVKVNDSDTTVMPVASAGGWYCFNAAEGANTIAVVFKSTVATKEYACVFKDQGTVKFEDETANYAENMGLDSTVFTVTSKANTSKNPAAIYGSGNGTLRVYGDTEVIFTATSTIASVKLTIDPEKGQDIIVKVNGEAVTGAEGVYTINATSFTLTAESQVRLAGVEITLG